MPVYEYDCPACGDFTAMRPMSECREPQPCPSCGVPAPRVLLSAPRLPVLGAAARKAYAINERSAHEPKRSGVNTHEAGCACCRPGARSTGTRGDGMKNFPSRRPWMISHY